MLSGDIRTQMVEHKICLHTLASSHIGHVDNTVLARINRPHTEASQ